LKQASDRGSNKLKPDVKPDEVENPRGAIFDFREFKNQTNSNELFRL